MSKDKAASDYGVVFGADGTFDAAATEAKRKALRDERGAPAPFSFGFTPPERMAAE